MSPLHHATEQSGSLGVRLFGPASLPTAIFPRGKEGFNHDGWYEAEVMRAEDDWNMVSKSIFSYVHMFSGNPLDSLMASLTHLTSSQDVEGPRKLKEGRSTKIWRTADTPGKKSNRPWPQPAFRSHASASG